jgi:hypothetical protein
MAGYLPELGLFRTEKVTKGSCLVAFFQPVMVDRFGFGNQSYGFPIFLFPLQTLQLKLLTSSYIYIYAILCL